MGTALIIVAIIAVSYLIGSIPFGLLLSKKAGLGDIRAIGSGNIGATNVLRTGNRKIAAITLVLDMLKGFVPVLATYYYNPSLAPLAGLCAVVGHVFPVWLKYKGGKGVATAFGVLFGLHWSLGVMACLVWALAFYFSRYSSVASLATFAFIPVYSAINLGSFSAFCCVIAIALIIILRHRDNIRRLYAGEESRTTFKKQR